VPFLKEADGLSALQTFVYGELAPYIKALACQQRSRSHNQFRIWAVSLPFQATAQDQVMASAPGRLATQHLPENAPSNDLSNTAGASRPAFDKSYEPVNVSTW
jgi:hypothetical protein